MSGPSSSPGHPASDPPGPGATIDELIRWVEGKRKQYPESALADLIASDSLPDDSLVELVAVDLIGQRRRGIEVTPEDYLRQFPQLAVSDGHVLDLIDAELCVRRELHDDRDVAFYVNRFPQLADEIRQLVHLTPGPINSPEVHGSPANGRSESPGNGPRPTGQGTVGIEFDQSSQSDSFLLQRDLTVAGGHRPAPVQRPDGRNDDSVEMPIPIKPPDWMAGSRCIATSQRETGRYWLAMGRDTQRNETVAMKIIPLPASLGRTERTRILDLCETSSSVTHPAWIAPRIAAINNGHLAVVRPWIFGAAFTNNRPNAPSGGPAKDPSHANTAFFSESEAVSKRLTSLVRIAYALSAAHRIGATHGSVKAENIITDHESAANLIDAVSGVGAWEHYLSIWDNDLSLTLDARIRRDTCGLVAVIAKECIESPETAMLDWINRLTHSIDFRQADACALIGERLQSLLDQPPGKRSWWRK